MLRKVPTTSIDILGQIDGDPLKYVQSFVLSKQATKEFESISKKPIWDTVGDSVEESYLNCRRNHDAMMRQFEVLIEQKRLQSIANNSRMYSVNRDVAFLRDRLLKANLFIREFAEKRRIALRKFRQEVEVQNDINSAADKMRNDLTELQEFRHELKMTAEEYSPYERVLKDVVAQSKVFGSMKDLLNKCDALMLTQMEISELNQKKVAEMENMRKRFIVIAKDAALEVLGLQNTLSSIDRLSEKARSECFKWEKTLKKVNEAIDYGQMQKHYIINGVDYIYKSLCHRRGMIPAYIKTVDRVDFIKSEVQLMRDVLAECIEHQGDDV